MAKAMCWCSAALTAHSFTRLTAYATGTRGSPNRRWHTTPRPIPGHPPARSLKTTSRRSLSNGTTGSSFPAARYGPVFVHRGYGVSAAPVTVTEVEQTHLPPVQRFGCGIESMGMSRHFDASHFHEYPFGMPPLRIACRLQSDGASRMGPPTQIQLTP